MFESGVLRLANNKPDSIWNNINLLNALIDASQNADMSFDRIAAQLTADFKLPVTPGAVSGKIGRLRKAGMVFPERFSFLKDNKVSDATKQAVRQDIRDGCFSRSVIAERNGVSPKYVKGQRDAIRNEEDIINRRINRTPKPYKKIEIEPPVLQSPPPPPPVPAIIIPFEPPPRRAPIGNRTCEFLEGKKKPWLRCTEPTAYHTSWCDKHGKIVFIVWPPAKEKERNYG